MGRRGKYPPNWDLQTQGLSESADGLSVQPVLTYVDDLSGEIKPMHPRVAQQRINSAKVMTDYRQRMRALRIEAERKALERIEHQRKLTEDIFRRKMGLLPSEPTLAHNQTKLRDDLVLSVRKAIPPWRRM